MTTSFPPALRAVIGLALAMPNPFGDPRKSPKCLHFPSRSTIGTAHRQLHHAGHNRNLQPVARQRRPYTRHAAFLFLISFGHGDETQGLELNR